MKKILPVIILLSIMCCAACGKISDQTISDLSNDTYERPDIRIDDDNTVSEARSYEEIIREAVENINPDEWDYSADIDINKVSVYFTSETTVEDIDRLAEKISGTLERSSKVDNVKHCIFNVEDSIVAAKSAMQDENVLFANPIGYVYAAEDADSAMPEGDDELY